MEYFNKMQEGGQERGLFMKRKEFIDFVISERVSILFQQYGRLYGKKTTQEDLEKSLELIIEGKKTAEELKKEWEEMFLKQGEFEEHLYREGVKDGMQLLRYILEK